MAKLLPRDSFTIQSELSPEAIAARLSQSITPAPTFSFNWPWQKPQVPYHGRVTLKGFEARRVINHQNSFLPKIQGEFYALSTGTAVQITMALHPFVAGFSIVWGLLWFGLTLPFLLAGPVNGITWIFVGAPFLFFGIAWLSFWTEVQRSRRDLLEILGGQILEASESVRHLGFAPPRQGFKRQPWILTGLSLAIIALVILLQQQQSTQQANVVANPLADPAAACSAPCHYSNLRSITASPRATVVAVSPDGSLVASGGKDKAIHVWDVKSGQLLHTLQSDSGKITALAIAPNNQTIVSGAGDRMVRIWDLNAPSNWPKVLQHGFKPRIIRITQDGKSIISATNTSIKRWDLATGELLSQPIDEASQAIQVDLANPESHAPYDNVFAINQPGTVALVQSGNDLLALNLDTNQQLKLPYNSRHNTISNFAISPNGKIAASQHHNQWRKYETRLKVWDLTQGSLHTDRAIDFSRKSFSRIPMVLTDAEVLGQVAGQLTSWEFDSTEVGQVLNEQKVQDLTMSSDGKVLAGLQDLKSGQTTIQLLERQ